MSERNPFFTYNLPLQIWPDGEGDARILNYMPRRESCTSLNLSDVLGEKTREEFLEQTALLLENLARLMRQAKDDPTLTVYYPDEGLPTR